MVAKDRRLYDRASSILPRGSPVARPAATRREHHAGSDGAIRARTATSSSLARRSRGLAAHQHVRMSVASPFNLRRRDYRPRIIDADAAYGAQVFVGYLAALGLTPASAASLRGRRILEIGPGHSLATALLLACTGARVSVIDRFPAPWVKPYHMRLVRALLEWVATEHPALDPTPLREVLRHRGFVPAAVTTLRGALHEIDASLEPFDVVLSNATLEHVDDVPRAIARLAVVTAPGGVGMHQIDCRDHRDFGRPLEYLTLSEDRFRALFHETHGECGNRVRASAFVEAFRHAGFEVVEARSTLRAPSAYLVDVRSRIHPELLHITDDDLAVLSVHIHCRLPERPSATADDPRQLTPFHSASTHVARVASPTTSVSDAILATALDPRERRSLRRARAWDRIGVRAHLAHALYVVVRPAYRVMRTVYAALGNSRALPPRGSTGGTPERT